MIFDTNAYSALLQGDAKVAHEVELTERLALPLPVMAELRNGFLGGSKPIENEQNLLKFLAQRSAYVLIPGHSTTHLYAELQQYAKKRGRTLSNNDIWIAALAREDGDKLVTYDRDFAVFQDLFGEKLVILEV